MNDYKIKDFDKSIRVLRYNFDKMAGDIGNILGRIEALESSMLKRIEEFESHKKDTRHSINTNIIEDIWHDKAAEKEFWTRHTELSRPENFTLKGKEEKIETGKTLLTYPAMKEVKTMFYECDVAKAKAEILRRLELLRLNYALTEESGFVRDVKQIINEVLP